MSNWVLDDVLRAELPEEGCDAVVSLSALHHLPLPEALPRLAGLLRPGGVLAAIALPRVDLPRELPVELVAAAGHRVFGAAFAPARRAGLGSWYRQEVTRAVMPVVLDPQASTRAVRAAASVLPGARVRRLVFWRYLLTWRKPG